MKQMEKEQHTLHLVQILTCMQDLHTAALPASTEIAVHARYTLPHEHRAPSHQARPGIGHLIA
eukprot:12423636-Karenia_brevis.AAC.1